jgi:hypothetical protein
MGRYGKLDPTGRGEQLEGWFKCHREDCTRTYKRGSVSSTGGSHVRLRRTNSLSVADRPATSLNRMQTSPEALSTTLRLIDIINISRSNGDCVVLLLVHPGPNLLGRYLPLYRINALLLAEPPLSRLSPHSPQGDVFMNEVGEGGAFRDVENTDTMDLATFLE